MRKRERQVANKKAEEMTEELKDTEVVEENGEKADTPPTQEELLAKIAKLEEELAELGDKHLRMAAEYENFRRRSKEEKDATYSVAKADTVGELLPIIDNLERAALYDDGEKVKEGLVMTLKSVESVFAKLGVESVGKVGDIFDPNLHNAVLHDEDPEKSEGEITDVFQKGYRAKDRIIRFAMVKTVN